MDAMNARTNLGLLGLGLGGMFLAGCAGRSVWDQTFVGAPDATRAMLGEKAPVRQRNIPWNRMQAALAELEKDASAGDVHPDDWTADQKQAAKAKLLHGLQFGGDPAKTEVLGRCMFRTAETILPDGPDREALDRTARKVGATDVVWSTKILGKTEKVVQHPVTSWTTTNFWGPPRDRERWWDDNYTQSTTTWVPVRVPADDSGFVAYFLRGG
jgi:hypothetical protein